jgi:hypothetical protein
MRWLVIVDQPRPWKPKVQDGLPLSPGWTQKLDQWRSQGETFTILARQPETNEPQFSVLHWNNGWTEEWSSPLADADGILEQMKQGESGTVAFFRLLVCTHGSRDSCCGTLGVRAAQLLRECGNNPDGAAPVWEVSHLGGHRFAPTLLAIPSWRMYGRLPLQADELRLWLDAVRQGQSDARSGLRGHAAYEPQLQVLEAELFLRKGYWPRTLTRVDEDTVVVDWPDGLSERWEVSWVPRVHRGPQSCKDVPDGITSEYTSYWLEDCVCKGSVE